jgi:predicted Zn finger-like uncharacterized protein
MLIVCPNCATSYQVEPNSLGQGGRSVRCARCRNVWFATTLTLVPALAAADDWDVMDTGPRVPLVDSSPPAEAAPTELAALPDGTAAAAENPALAEISETPASEPASTEGIDVAALGAEMDAKRAEQEAAADAVLAEVAAEEPAAPDSPSLVPAMQPAALVESQPAAASAAGEDIETFAARRARGDALRRRRWLVSGLPAAIFALAAVNAAIVVWRTDVVRLLPQTASLYAAIGLPVNLRGLAFEDIRMSRAEQDGVGVLVVEGSIVNVSGRPVEVPRLRLAVRNGGKNEIYAWTAQPSRSILGPGETLPFRSRLASPPAEAREVMVRFFSRRDVVAGLN